MQSLANIFWLIGKELKSVLGDPVMVILILWSFVGALMPPWFQEPVYLNADQAAAAMDRGEIMFALAFPPDFAADTIAGKVPMAQLLADATAVSQAQLGTDYLRNIVQLESLEFLSGSTDAPPPDLRLELRRAFNANGNPVWFKSMSSLLN